MNELYYQLYIFIFRGIENENRWPLFVVVHIVTRVLHVLLKGKKNYMNLSDDNVRSYKYKIGVKF